MAIWFISYVFNSNKQLIKMKNILTVIAIIWVVVFTACNKEDSNTKRLTRHEGRWTIDYANILNYDSSGTATVDSIINSPGELVLFRTGSFSALYGYRQAIFLIADSLGSHGYYFDYMFDGKRIDIQNCQAPFIINGTYTSAIDKGREQQWELYGANGNTAAATTLTGKFVLHMVRSKD